MNKVLKFSFHGMLVGQFEEAEYPRSGGRFRYMPYRDPGHYEPSMFMSNKKGSCA